MHDSFPSPYRCPAAFSPLPSPAVNNQNITSTNKIIRRRPHNKTSTTTVTRMSFCVLGSGSAGNCSALLLHYPNKPKPRVILIDLGLALRDTERRLRDVDLALHMVDHIIITHFDSDHFRPAWTNRLKKMRSTVHFHLNHWPHANRAGAPEFKHETFDDSNSNNKLNKNSKPFKLAPGCTLHPFTLAHDVEGTTGFRFDTAAGRLGFATDLGRVPPHLLQSFNNLTLLALESNYCPQLQEASNRPHFLKQRIMGGRGHLSNEQSFDAVRHIEKNSPDLRKVVLLHLSRECNSPGRILNIYAKHPDLSRKLIITNQTKPTNWINIDAPDHVEMPGGPTVHTQHHLFASKTNHP